MRFRHTFLKSHLFLFACKCFFVFGKDLFLQTFSNFCFDWVNNVLKFSIVRFSAWHWKEISVFAVDDFDVVNNKFVVDCDGSNRLEFVIVVYKPYSNVCDFQMFIPSFFRLTLLGHDNYITFSKYYKQNRIIYKNFYKICLKTFALNSLGKQFL